MCKNCVPNQESDHNDRLIIYRQKYCGYPEYYTVKYVVVGYLGSAYLSVKPCEFRT